MFNKLNITYILGYLILIGLNTLFIGSYCGLLVSVPQIAFVLYLIYKGNLRDALFWHIIFTITCVASSETQMDLDLQFAYQRIKIVGLLSTFHIISFILFGAILLRYKISNRQTLFFKFRQMMLFFLFFGILVGVAGLLWGNYIPSGFSNKVIYMLTVYIHVEMLARCIDSQLIEKAFNHSVPMLIAAPIAAVVSLIFFNKGTVYSDILPQTSMTFLVSFASALFIGLLYIKWQGWLIAGIVFLTWNVLIGTYGQVIIYFMLGLLIMVLLTFKRNVTAINKTKMQWVVIVCIGCVIALSPVLYNRMSEFTKYKLESVISLFNVFLLPFDFDKIHEIGSSPYVRVVEVLNVVAESLKNPFRLIFGVGYGGYYTDVMNILSIRYVDLTLGGFPEDIVAGGRFPNTHIGLVNVFLYHGLIGLIWILRLGISYMKRIKNNFLAFAVFPFFFFQFMAMPMLGMTAIFLLFASEYKLDEKNTVHR